MAVYEQRKPPRDIAWASINDVFEDHARCTPDALAVEAQGERRSYAELAARVDLFAARLAERLHDGERLVGVCLRRDVDLPAWLLAILKVGGAYMPIDPTTPPARLAHMIEDARPTLIVASRCHADVVRSCGTAVIVAEEEAVAPPAPVAIIGPCSLAYVIFTSGSTGRPKGVEIEHGSLVALMATMAVSPGFRAGERMLGLTRISFDLSVPDMFLPFYVGGSLQLVELDVAADPERLAAAFEAYRPDLAQGTPSTWRTLLEAGWGGLPDLRILAGGEAVTRALADRLLPCCGELWNIYGPTEATVWATAWKVRPDDDPIPIGWPMAGVVVDVVGDDGMALSAEAVGEIVIGGVGVARGYRNRPELTADRFVARADGSRAYRTGDLGRFDDAGALHCLGRLDDQVKVRGFRIELGDVEAALAAHSSVGWCAARLWVNPAGDALLIGYVVSRAEMPLSPSAIKAFLATRVVPYMIPDRILTLDVMPLTANGKIDRGALPDPVEGADSLPEAPADDSVRGRLASIWVELLGKPSIADGDDFFELGGYSLMTVRLARRIESGFGVKLALVDLMQNSTLADMARRIERGDTMPARPILLLNKGGSRPPLYWLDAGPLMRTMTGSLSPDQPAFALNTDVADEDALADGELSISAVAARLKRHLVADQPSGPYYLGGWCRWGIVAFELAQQLINAGETVGLLVLLDADRPGSRSQRPRLRERLTRWLRPVDATEEPPSFSQRVEAATRSYPANRYPGDVLLLRPADDPGDGGWSAMVDGDLSIQGVAGDHVSMVRGEAARDLADKIDDALRVAQRRPASFPLVRVRAVKSAVY